MNSRGENNFITDLVACSLGLGGIQFLPHAAAKVGQVTSLRLSDLQVKASVLTKDGKVSKQGGSEGRCGGEKGAICVDLLQGNEVSLPDLSTLLLFSFFQNLQHEDCASLLIFSQRDMSQQMLCAFDANSMAGITAR